MASFIGTSNRKDFLTSPTGSRRFLCVELTKKINCTPLEHKQLFSLLKAELDEGRRYWFTAGEETELMKRNRPFYTFPVNHDVFFRNYRLPQEGEAAELVAPGELFGELVKAYPLEMRGMNMQRFGRMLTAIGAERVHTVKGNMYRIVRAA